MTSLPAIFNFYSIPLKEEDPEGFDSRFCIMKFLFLSVNITRLDIYYEKNQIRKNKP